MAIKGFREDRTEQEISEVIKWSKLVLMVLGVMLMASPVFAQDGGTSISFSASFGAGLVLLGAGFGIGRIGAAAVESMARQPEVAGNIQTAMIIAAALIEGATFFALVVCWLS